MVGDDGSGTPRDFPECVSQDQLHEAIEQGQQVMTNNITQAITAALKDLRLHESIERLDKRISTLTDRVVALDTCSPPNEDEDMVYDVHGNTDEAATIDARL
jgi:hypothetical protein